MEIIFFLIILMLLITLFIRYTKWQKEERFKYLMGKYNNDNKLVEMIMEGKVWQGQTSEQLLDALGAPKDIDQKVFKSKIKETWKYHPSGKNRYNLRIIVENNVVVGWDHKD